jgi:hypothetical protein
VEQRWEDDLLRKGNSVYAAAVNDCASGEPKLLFTLADRISDVSVMRDGSLLLVLTNEASAIQPIRLLINAQ